MAGTETAVAGAETAAPEIGGPGTMAKAKERKAKAKAANRPGIGEQECRRWVDTRLMLDRQSNHKYVFFEVC
jgi:hypothetical protein